jgi:hypothetical protein
MGENRMQNQEVSLTGATTVGQWQEMNLKMHSSSAAQCLSLQRNGSESTLDIS